MTASSPIYKSRKKWSY